MADGTGAGGAQPPGANSTYVPMDGGYQLTPEQVEQNITKATDLIKAYQDIQQDVRLFGLQSIGSDDTSHFQAAQIRARAEQLLTRNASQIDFLANWMQLLQKAKVDYMNQEHLTAAQWARLAGGPGS